jgi:hypothetical protein
VVLVVNSAVGGGERERERRKKGTFNEGMKECRKVGRKGSRKQ